MNDERPKLGAFPYVIGGLSYIPLIGIVFGVVAIICGLVTKKSGGRRLAAIGAGGIAFTIIVYGALFYVGFAQRGGFYDGLRSKLAASMLTLLVNDVEAYKLQTGRYPDSLETLQPSLPKNSPVTVFDPTDVQAGAKSRYFYYEIVDASHYYLLSVGPDGQPFTQDDILPNVEVKPGSKLGLVTKKAK